MLGVLGGMGPMATADFLQKFVKLWPAEKDQDHPQVVVFSNPKIPDRVGAIMGTSAISPLPALVESAKRLEEFGAQLLAMPCHTAHYWYAQIAQALTIPLLHMADLTCEEILRKRQQGEYRVCVLATQATLEARIYQDRFKLYGIPLTLPGQDNMERYVLPAIAAVKRNELHEACRLLTDSVDRLVSEGIDMIVLACTELPILLRHVDTSILQRCIDPTETLARACVDKLKTA